MGQFQLFPIVLLVMSWARVVVSAPNLTCYFGPAQNIDDLDPFLCTRVVVNAVQTIAQEPNGPRIDINTPRLAKLVALKIVNPDLQLILGIDSLNVQTLLQKPDVYTQVASQLARLLVAVHTDGIDLAYEPEPSQNATQVLTVLFSHFQPIFAPFQLTTSLTVKDNFGPTAALAALKIDHVHVLPSAKPSITPELEERQVWAKIEPWLKTGFTGAQLSVGTKIGGTSWRQDSPAGRYMLALDGVSRPKICKTLLTPGWQSSPPNVTKPSAVLSTIRSADNQQVISFASAKGIPKLIQRFSARVGGVAVMDADLDDARNACGEGTWPVMKVIRESLKLPALNKEGEKTKIRLKLSMEAVTGLNIFRWLNDDTESRGKRQKREDPILTWPKGNTHFEKFNDRGHLTRSKPTYIEVDDYRPDPPRHYGQLRKGSRKRQRKSYVADEFRSGINLPIPEEDILPRHKSGIRNVHGEPVHVGPVLYPGLDYPAPYSPQAEKSSPRESRTFEDLPTRKGSLLQSKNSSPSKASSFRRVGRFRRSSSNEVPEEPILSDCGQAPKVVPVTTPAPVKPPVVSRKSGQPFLEIDPTDFANDPVHNADHFELKEHQEKRVRRHASNSKSQKQQSKPGAGKQASRGETSGGVKTNGVQGKGPPRNRARGASNNDKPEPRCGGAHHLGVAYPAYPAIRAPAYRRYRRSLEFGESEPNAVLGESNLPITVGDDEADLDESQPRPVLPRFKRQPPNSQAKRHGNKPKAGQARAKGNVPSVTKPAKNPNGTTKLGTGAKPIPAEPNKVAPKPAPGTSRQPQLKTFFTSPASQKRVRRRVFTRPQDSVNPPKGKLVHPQPRKGVAPRPVQTPPRPIKSAPPPKVIPYRRIRRYSDILAGKRRIRSTAGEIDRPNDVPEEDENVHLRRKDLQLHKLSQSNRRSRGQSGNPKNKGRGSKVRKSKSGPKQRKSGYKVRVPSPVREVLDALVTEVPDALVAEVPDTVVTEIPEVPDALVTGIPEVPDVLVAELTEVPDALVTEIPEVPDIAELTKVPDALVIEVTDAPVPEVQEVVVEEELAVQEVVKPEVQEVSEDLLPDFELRRGNRTAAGKVGSTLPPPPVPTLPPPPGPPPVTNRTRRSTGQINRPPNAVRPIPSNSGPLPHRFHPSPANPRIIIEVPRNPQIPSSYRKPRRISNPNESQVQKPVLINRRVRRQTTDPKQQRRRTKAQQAKQTAATPLKALNEKLNLRRGTPTQAKRRSPIRTPVQRRRVNRRRRIQKAKAAAAAQSTTTTTAQPTTVTPTTTAPTTVLATTTAGPTGPTTVNSTAKSGRKRREVQTAHIPGKKTSSSRNKGRKSKATLRKVKESPKKSPPSKKALAPKTQIPAPPSKKNTVPAAKSQNPIPVTKTKAPVPVPKQNTVPAAKNQKSVPVPKTQTPVPPPKQNKVPVPKTQTPVPPSKQNTVPAAKNQNPVPVPKTQTPVPPPKQNPVLAATNQNPVPVPKTQTPVPVSQQHKVPAAKNENPVPVPKPNTVSLPKPTPLPAAKNENRVPNQRTKRSPEESFGAIDEEGRKRRNTALGSQPMRIKREIVKGGILTPTLNQPANLGPNIKKNVVASLAVQDAIRKEKQARRDKIRALMIKTPSISTPKPKKIQYPLRPSRTSATFVKLTGLKKPRRPSVLNTANGTNTLPNTTAGSTLPGSQQQYVGQGLPTTQRNADTLPLAPSLSVISLSPVVESPPLTNGDTNVVNKVSSRVRERSGKYRRRY